MIECKENNIRRKLIFLLMGIYAILDIGLLKKYYMQ